MNPALLAMLIQSGLGLVSGGIGSSQNAQEENSRRRAAARQRQRLQNLINEIRSVNYADVDMAQSAAYTNATNQATASAASRGVSGGQRGATQDRVLSGAIADLARFKTEDQRARNQQVAGILQNDAYTVPEDPMSVMGQFLLGSLMGAAGGGAEGLGAVLGNSELSGELFGSGGGAGPTPDASFDSDSLGFVTGANMGGNATRSFGGGASLQAPGGGGGGGAYPSSMQLQGTGGGAGAGLYGGVLGDMLTRTTNTSIQRG